MSRPEFEPTGFAFSRAKGGGFPTIGFLRVLRLLEDEPPVGPSDRPPYCHVAERLNARR